MVWYSWTLIAYSTARQPHYRPNNIIDNEHKHSYRVELETPAIRFWFSPAAQCTKAAKLSNWFRISNMFYIVASSCYSRATLSNSIRQTAQPVTINNNIFSVHLARTLFPSLRKVLLPFLRSFSNQQSSANTLERSHRAKEGDAKYTFNNNKRRVSIGTNYYQEKICIRRLHFAGLKARSREER